MPEAQEEASLRGYRGPSPQLKQSLLAVLSPYFRPLLGVEAFHTSVPSMMNPTLNTSTRQGISHRQDKAFHINSKVFRELKIGSIFKGDPEVPSLNLILQRSWVTEIFSVCLILFSFKGGFADFNELTD